MKGDFARLTFDPAKHYDGVLHQQGRVWLEADWNEELQTRLFLDRAYARDIVGVCGVPDPGTAFRIEPPPAGAPPRAFDFLIRGGPGPEGHCYVGGALCRLDASVSYFAQPDFPGAPAPQFPVGASDLRALVYLETWQRHVTYLEDEELREVALGGPDTTTRLRTVAQVKLLPLAPGTPPLSSSEARALLLALGRGTLTTLQPADGRPFDPCRMPDPALFSGRENRLYRVEVHSPGDVLGGGELVFDLELAANVAAGGRSLRLAAPLTPQQIEALGGPGPVTLFDTNGQEQVVVASAQNSGGAGRVELAFPVAAGYTTARGATLHVGGFAFSRALRQDAPAGATTLAVTLTPPELSALRRAGTVTLLDDDGQTETVFVDSAASTTSSIALVTPIGSDETPSGLRNSYSRARGATVIGGAARFKWSRDNAAFAVAVTAVSADRFTLTLAALGRDEATALRELDLVEVGDDASDLGPASGHLTYLDGDPDPDRFTVTLADPLPSGYQLDRHLKLRRWDGQGIASAGRGDIATPELNLGDGVRVVFGGADLRPGDYWQFAARSADGSVEPLAAAPPRGIERGYCPLALVRWLAGGELPGLVIEADYRIPFLPLAERAVRLNAVRTGVGAALELANDGDVHADDLAQGVQLVCSEPIRKLSILGKPVVSVTLEVPFPTSDADQQLWGAPRVGTLPLTLDGDLASAGERDEVIFWRPSEAAQAGIVQIFQRIGREARLLARLRARGNFIWSDSRGARLYLDGETFGQPGLDPEDVSVHLRLPTGDGRRGGDFELWFYLIAPTNLSPLVDQVVIEAETVVGGAATQGSVTLTIPASAGGAQLAISSDNPAVSVPQSVVVAEGANGATFAINTAPVATATTVTVSARLGTSQAADTIVVQPPIPQRLELSPASVIGTMSTTARIVLSGPAPANGIAVSLAAGSPVAQIPQSVTVPAGQSSAQFQVSAAPVNAQQVVTLTASIGAASVAADLTVEVGLGNLTLSPASVIGGNTVTGTVTLSGPAPRATAITLTSSNTSVATLPGSVTIAAGQTAASFQVRTSAVSGSATVTVAAAQEGLRPPRQAALTVSPKPKDTKEGKDTKEKDTKELKEKDTKDIRDEPIEKVRDKVRDTGGGIILPRGGVQPVLGGAPEGDDPLARLAARVEELERMLATGRSFIRPEERPPVGESALGEARPEADEGGEEQPAPTGDEGARRPARRRGRQGDEEPPPEGEAGGQGGRRKGRKGQGGGGQGR
ncbi:MAG TPA: DUF6519 domain-containing protein [Chloroflexaceae bacterium]|nr:DUF6519 domain-containing protein [Chloroflexaceae bacterium]